MRYLLVFVALTICASLIGCDPPPPPPTKVFEGVLKKVKIEHPAIWRRDKERTYFTFADGTVLMVKGTPEGMPYAKGKLNRVTTMVTPLGDKLVDIKVLDR
jgi:hypothetical protein